MEDTKENKKSGGLGHKVQQKMEGCKTAETTGLPPAWEKGGAKRDEQQELTRGKKSRAGEGPSSRKNYRALARG